MLSFLRKGKYENDVSFCKTKRKGFSTGEILSGILNKTDNETEYSTLKQKDVFHGEDNLIGISRNEDNIVESLLIKIEKQGDYKFTDAGIASGIDVLQEVVVKNHLKEIPSLKIGEGIFVLTDDELDKLGLSQNEMSLIRPFYTTSEIIKYGTCSINKRWLIYTTTEKIKHIDDYPKIKTHLDKFSKIMTSDNKPYGLHRARDEKYFKGAKILCLRMTREPLFAYVGNDSYVARPFLIIQPSENELTLKYLVSLLNSKLFYFWFYHRGKRKIE